MRGHAYSITKIVKAKIQTPKSKPNNIQYVICQNNIKIIFQFFLQLFSVTGEIPLVRVRNPWGNETGNGLAMHSFDIGLDDVSVPQTECD